MLKLKYDLQDYAKMRLNNTIVKLDDNPARFYYYDGWKYDVLFLDPDLGITRIDIKKDRDRIDITPIKLGYVNSPKDTIFLSRVPCRKWKQGLSPENLYAEGVVLHYFDNSALLEKISKDGSLLSTINRKYPTIHECVESKVPKAFHKDFAIDSNSGLLYSKGRLEIGKLGLHKIILRKNYLYLKDNLMGVLK